MALSLGLENIKVKEEVYTSTEELLQAELEFQEIYQSFVDYKNVCEIVVKAKASNEALAFANNLLNTSVESIDVSVEGLADKFKAVWQKFLTIWEKFVSWAKGMFKKAQTVNKNLNLPVEVNPSTSRLQDCVQRLEKADYTELDTSGLTVTVLHYFKSDHEKLNTIEEVKTWVALCKKFIEGFNKEISIVKKLWNDRTYNDRTANKEYKYKNMVEYIRYVSMYGSKIIKNLQETITKLCN